MQLRDLKSHAMRKVALYHARLVKARSWDLIRAVFHHLDLKLLRVNNQQTRSIIGLRTWKKGNTCLDSNMFYKALLEVKTILFSNNIRFEEDQV